MASGALRAGVIAALAAALLAFAFSAPAATASRSGCLPRAARTVAEDPEVRVYSLEAHYREGGHRYAREVTYACLLRTGATLKLTDPETGRPATNSEIALNGPVIAYTYTATGIDTGRTEIVTAAVATGRTILTVPDAAGFTDACVIAFRELEDLVVTAHGAAAWTLRTGRGCRTETFQAYDASATAAPTLLDEGLGLDPASLRVSPRAVSWENEGRRRYARLR